jgi:ribosomal-protein-alanine N-acetyltransferase
MTDMQGVKTGNGVDGVDQNRLIDLGRGHLSQIHSLEEQAQTYPWSAEAVEQSINAGHQGWVVPHTRDEYLIAYVLWMDTGESLELLNLVVAHSNRRQGWGRCLLKRTLQEAVHRHRSAVFLEVRPSNVGAVTLYRNLGFDRVSTRPAYYRALSDVTGQIREDAWLMRRQIDPCD